MAKKTLNERVHRCSCGCEMDRDLAAAQVVLRWAMGEIADESSSEQPGQELSRTG